MKIKLVVFDIDGTLAPTEQCIPESISHRLRSLEKRDIRIVLISGRTASYLAGLARGMGIKNPLLAGENGGVLFDPITFWEKRLDGIPQKIVTEIKRTLCGDLGELWFQSNQTMLTVVPKDLAMVEKLFQIVWDHMQKADYDFQVNKYNDSIEIMPQRNSKGRALAVIKDILGIDKKEVVVFGNTVVDLSMKDEAEEFLIIGDTLKCEGLCNYNSIEDALGYFEQKYY